MTTLQLIFAIVQLFLGVVIIGVVLFQNAKDNRMGTTITGGAETFFGKFKGRSIDAKLSKWTAVLAGLFALLTIGLNILVAANK